MQRRRFLLGIVPLVTTAGCISKSPETDSPNDAFSIVSVRYDQDLTEVNLEVSVDKASDDKVTVESTVRNTDDGKTNTEREVRQGASTIDTDLSLPGDFDEGTQFDVTVELLDGETVVDTYTGAFVYR